MKYKVMYLILFFVLSANFSFGQASQLFYFSKTWNFLKYYHPDLASGKINANSLFLEQFEKVNSSQSTDEVIELLLNQVYNRTLSNSKLTKKQFKNLSLLDRFSWFSENTEISRKNQEVLTSIFNNRFIKENHHYLPKLAKESELPNEKDYHFNSNNSIPLPLRILAFAKIQGCIDYLYPYKYTISIDFDQIAVEKLATLIHIQTRREYETILAGLVSKFEDSQSFRFFDGLNFKKEIFRSYFFAPFEYAVRSNYILVTGYIDSVQCSRVGIRIGDKITSVNFQTVPDLILEKSKLLSTSNKLALLHRLSNYRDNLIWNSENPNNTFSINRDEEELTLTLRFLNPNDKLQAEIINNYNAKIISEENQTTINDSRLVIFKANDVSKYMENSKLSESLLDSAVNDAFKKKAIVFDMRGNLNSPDFFYKTIYKYFSKPQNYFHRINFLNYQNIGTWFYQKDSEHYFPNYINRNYQSYKGNVFILVNPETLGSAELYTMSLQHIFPQAITIGQTTAGAIGNIKTMPLPGGYQLSFTGATTLYPDRTATQKLGVKIDQYTSYSDQDAVKKRDKEIEKVKNLLFVD